MSVRLNVKVGGGITPETAPRWIAAGASHVIVTSFVFKNGKVPTISPSFTFPHYFGGQKQTCTLFMNQICMENLEKMVSAVGREHLVLDLSCRKKPRLSSHDQGEDIDARGGTVSAEGPSCEQSSVQTVEDGSAEVRVREGRGDAGIQEDDAYFVVTDRSGKKKCSLLFLFYMFATRFNCDMSAGRSTRI